MKACRFAPYGLAFALAASAFGSAMAKDVTFVPKNSTEYWGWVESSYKQYWVDGVIPASGDTITLVTTNEWNVQSKAKQLYLHWPTGVKNYKLIGGVDWVHEYRDCNNPNVNIEMGDPSQFFGLWRFTTSVDVTLPSATSDYTPTIRKMEASGRMRFNMPNAGSRVVVSNLVGMGTVAKTGVGELEVLRTGGDLLNLDLQKGSLVLHEQETGDASAFEAVLKKAKVRFDASDESRFVYNDEGRVSRWNASSPNTGYYATLFTTNKYGSAACLNTRSAPLPRRVANYNGTGKSVVDFGPYRTITDADLDESGAASLQFYNARVNFSEAFIVFADNDPLCRQDIFTDSHNYTFRRGYSDNTSNTTGENYNRTPKTGGILERLEANRSGRDVRFNGRLVAASFPVGGKDLKVISIDCVKAGNVQSSESMIGSFARRDANHIGGIVVAEFIGFTVSLTDAERQAVNRYLMEKWVTADKQDVADLNGLTATDERVVKVGAGEEVRVNHVMAGARLVKEGAGTLTMRDIRGTANGATTVEVKAGGVSFAKTYAGSAAYAPAAQPLYHFDASDASSLTISAQDGTNFVTEIRDQNDATLVAKPVTGDMLTLKATTNNPPVATAPATPFLLAGAVNGKPVISCGGRADNNTIKKKGYETAGAFYIPSASTAVAGNSFEGFVVLKGGYCIYPFSSTRSELIAPDGWHILNKRMSLPLRSGEWTVNGEQVSPGVFAFDTAGFSGKYCVLRFSATDMVHINGLGFQDTNPYGIGGLTFGEWIVYNRRLTEQERHDTEAYLMKKWLDLGHPGDTAAHVAVDFASGVTPVVGAEAGADVRLEAISTTADTLVKTGEGKIEAEIPASVTKVEVRAGTFAEGDTVSNLVARALMHLDASAADSLTLEEGDGVTNVTKWADVRGEGYPYAWHNTARSALPVMLKANAQNGMNVIDTGAAKATGKHTEYPHPGRALWFNSGSGETNLRFREGFLVMATDSGNTAILGDKDTWSFHPSDTQLINNNIHAAWCLRSNSVWHVDNDEVNVLTYSRTTFRTTGTGYHVVSFAITNAFNAPYTGEVRAIGASMVSAASLAQDRGNLAGGVRYGEILFFAGALSEGEREALRKHLVRKWNTAELPAEERAMDSLTVAAGAKLTFRNTLKLASAGTLRATLPDGYALPEGETATTRTLIEAPAIEGSLDGWSTVVTGLPRRYTAQFYLRNGKIVLKVYKKGALIILR